MENKIEKNISELGFPLGLIVTKKMNDCMKQKYIIPLKKGGGMATILLTNKGLSSETINFSDPIKIYN